MTGQDSAQRWSPAVFAARMAAVCGAGTASAVVRACADRVRRPPPPPGPPLFVEASAPGFGDRWNTYVWSMQWWNGRLYAGTGRAFVCLEYLTIHHALPWLQRYPPRIDRDARCPESPYDLPLRGEIWSFDPARAGWMRVFQSPNDVPVPAMPGRITARDIGFRGMLAFTERDGTQALYAAGVSARTLDPQLPPPRLLRTVDGVTFDAVPASPGTTLGSLQALGFRGLAAFEDRLFVVAGNFYGDGVLLASDDPRAGSNTFQVVSPPGARVYEIAVFDGALYLGVRDPAGGYSVLKTRARGAPPYTFSSVVTRGGSRRLLRSHSILSMHVFGDALYIGTEFPAELLRVSAGGRWDLVAGAPRWTADGGRRPLSGRGDGLGFRENVSFDRMETHDGALYVGTADFTKVLRTSPLAPLLRSYMGCDLFVSRDGLRFESITQDGFGDPANGRVRTLASTPAGLFAGTGNALRGGRVYRGV